MQLFARVADAAFSCASLLPLRLRKARKRALASSIGRLSGEPSAAARVATAAVLAGLAASFASRKRAKASSALSCALSLNIAELAGGGAMYAGSARGVPFVRTWRANEFAAAARRPSWVPGSICRSDSVRDWCDRTRRWRRLHRPSSDRSSELEHAGRIDRNRSRNHRADRRAQRLPVVRHGHKIRRARHRAR